MTVFEPSYSRPAIMIRWAILAFASFLIVTNSFVIAGVLPEISSDLGASTTSIGYTITAYALVIAVLAPIFAVVFSRWSRTTLMVVGLALFSAGVVIAAVAPDYSVFAMGRVVAAIGGAAFTPTATAAAAAITPPARQGQAIAAVGIGITLASAVGAPLGTWLSAAVSWRNTMLIIAGLAALAAALVELVVRRIPISAPISFRQRFAVLRDRRIALTLIATFFVIIGFNIVYIYSSGVTGFTGTTLAELLLMYGVLGIIGNSLSGPLTDRFSSRTVGTTLMVINAVALGLIVLVGHSLVGLLLAFALWGLSAFGSLIPLQHRLLTIDTRTASVAISWYSTAMYLGIAAASSIGGIVISAGAPPLIPAIGAAVTVLAIGAFVGGFMSERSRRTSKLRVEIRNAGGIPRPSTGNVKAGAPRR